MQNSPAKSPFRRSKSENIKSVSNIKQAFRTQFFNRLKKSRSENADKLRRIIENYGDDFNFSSTNELRLILLSDPEAIQVLNIEEIEEAMADLLSHESQMQADNRIVDLEKENEALVNTLMNVCTCCGSFTVNLEICEECLRSFQKMEFN